MICTIILIALVFIKMCCGIYEGGKKENKREVIATIIATAISLALYYGAGLFDKLG